MVAYASSGETGVVWLNPERGSASIEFLVVAVGLLVPLAAATTTLSDIASAEFAATSSSRQGIRAFTRSESVGAGMARARDIERLALADHGLASATTELSLDCSVSDCLQRGAVDTLTVTIGIPLRFVPVLPGVDIPSRVTVSRSASARVSIEAVYR